MPRKPAWTCREGRACDGLAKIDFEMSRRLFKESKHRNTDLEGLKATIRAMLERLIGLDKTRADFPEMFED
jgi:type I restriction enzyme, R subunit